MIELTDDDLLLSDKGMERGITRFLKILGDNIWQNKIDKLDAEIRSSHTVFYHDFLIQRNPLLLPVKEFIQLRKSNKVIWRHKSDALMFLFSIAWVANKMYHGANEEGKKRIIGSLKSEEVRPFLFELQTLTHFLRNGFKVDLNDVNNLNQDGSNFDFLVKSEAITAEVECKWKNPDAGSKIPREVFYRLADRIVKKLRGSELRLLINLNVENRLIGNDQLFTEIADLIHNSILEGVISGSVKDEVSFEVTKLPDEIVVQNDAQAAELISKYYSPKAHFAIFSNNNVLLFRAESESNDEMLKSVYSALKGATKQLSGTLPSMITTFIVGISEDEFRTLTNEGGLMNMVAKYFDDQGRSFVHTLSFTSDQSVTRSGRVRTMNGPVAYWENDNSRYKYNQNPFGFSKR